MKTMTTEAKEHLPAHRLERKGKTANRTSLLFSLSPPANTSRELRLGLSPLHGSYHLVDPAREVRSERAACPPYVSCAQEAVAFHLFLPFPFTTSLLLSLHFSVHDASEKTRREGNGIHQSKKV